MYAIRSYYVSLAFSLQSLVSLERMDLGPLQFGPFGRLSRRDESAGSGRSVGFLCKRPAALLRNRLGSRRIGRRGVLGDDTRGQSGRLFRITSYNVCYTKLLRGARRRGSWALCLGGIPIL